jgi:hypothetical protein
MRRLHGQQGIVLSSGPAPRLSESENYLPTKGRFRDEPRSFSLSQIYGLTTFSCPSLLVSFT